MDRKLKLTELTALAMHELDPITKKSYYEKLATILFDYIKGKNPFYQIRALQCISAIEKAENQPLATEIIKYIDNNISPEFNFIQHQTFQKYKNHLSQSN